MIQHSAESHFPNQCILARHLLPDNCQRQLAPRYLLPCKDIRIQVQFAPQCSLLCGTHERQQITTGLLQQLYLMSISIVICCYDQVTHEPDVDAPLVPKHDMLAFPRAQSY